MVRRASHACRVFGTAGMPRLLTIECYGALPNGWVPFFSGPLPELGDGKVEEAPWLVPTGPQQWALQMAVMGPALDACLTACVPGMRPLQFPAFNLGRGCQPLPAGVQWTATFGPVLPPAALDFYYYSGWPAVRLRVIDGQDVRDVPLTVAGPGRTREEQLWYGSLPMEDVTRRWGCLLLGPHDAVARPPDGRLYRPLGSCVYLADGELFPAPPPPRRSAPRVETLRMHATALEHTFVVHIVVPRDYDVVTDRRFPVVLLNDGQNQFTDRGMWGGWHTDSTAAQLMRAGRMQETVLMAIEMHPDRNRAYLPRGDARTPAGQAADYTAFLADQVLPQLRRRYRVLAGPGSTAIVGSSNGAIHALSAGVHRPDTFGLVGCLSYARLDPEQNVLALAPLTQVPLQRVYLDSGTRRGESDRDGDSDDHALVTARLREMLLLRGLVLEQSLRYRLAYGDAHNEGAWRRRMPSCLEFILPPD